ATRPRGRRPGERLEPTGVPFTQSGREGDSVAAVHIVVMFTDLVGSTELSSRLDSAHAEALRQAHFGVLRRAVAGHDGTEVKNLGDGLMVTFPSASAALACAVAMQ